MRTRLCLALGLTLMTQPVHAEEAACKPPVGFYQPQAGMIGTARTARSIALIYLTDIYGETTIRRELPLNAVLDHGIWTVTGSLPKGLLGGVAEIRLCQRNGAVIHVVHGK
jgi:hypothetical protein